jgi:short-subunit dehydrogenase
VPTEFQARAGIKAQKLGRLIVRSAGRVAEDGYKGLRDGARVVVPGFPNQAAAVLSSVLPRTLMMRMSAAHNRDRG